MGLMPKTCRAKRHKKKKKKKKKKKIIYQYSAEASNPNALQHATRDTEHGIPNAGHPTNDTSGGREATRNGQSGDPADGAPPKGIVIYTSIVNPLLRE